MKILIDDGMASKGRKSGIGFFALDLFQHLRKIVDCDFSGYTVLGKLPRYIKRWAYIANVNIPFKFSKYDLIHHINNYSAYLKGRSKHVMTVHDLSMIRYPETIPIAWRHYNQYSLKKSVERADVILTLSRAIRTEILNIFPRIDPEKVYCCPPGIRHSFLTSRPQEELLKQIRLSPYSYFLCLGDLTRRKNIPFLLNVFSNLKKVGRISSKTKLILVGKPAWGFHEIKPLIDEKNGIIKLGYLNDEMIVSLYKYSKGLVFPSLYEGFGIPIVEAMYLDIPIIISSIPTSIELNTNHNNQMLTFELDDEEQLAQKLECLDKNWELIRKNLSYGDLSRYYYENIAQEHLNIYRLFCNGTYLSEA